jgi:polysaccharide biosynthesis/export protein VpsN
MSFLAPFLLAFFAILSTAPASAQEASYVLGANDVINISVYGEEDLSLREVRITDNGLVTYPLLGEVQVLGLTIRGLEERLRRGLVEEEYLIDPKVTITMVSYRPFYIDGEVEKPGAYPFEPGLTLRKAVSIAGGFTNRANRGSVIIHNSIEADAPSRPAGNLDTPIRPGEVINVPQRFF